MAENKIISDIEDVIVQLGNNSNSIENINTQLNNNAQEVKSINSKINTLITYGTADLSTNSTLATGTLYIVYKA